MNDETRHPERRAGQRIATGYGCTYGDRPGGPWCPAYDEGEDGWKLWNDAVSTGMKVGEALCPSHASAHVPHLSPAPAARACKVPTWCGMSDDSSVNERTAQGMARSEAYHADESGNYGIIRGGIVYCSDACLPPLAAQPAEAIRERLHASPCYCADCGYDHPAEQPKPAAKGPQRCENNDCETPLQNVAQRWFAYSDGSRRVMLEWSCEPCHLRDEVEFAGLMAFETTGVTGILRNPAIPERIVKPPMAHIAGMHDDDLIGGAR